MNKKFLILTIIPLAFVLTACTSESTEAPSDNGNAGAVNDGPQDENSTYGSLSDVLKLGKNMKCSASYMDEGVSFDMETYIAGDNMRTDSVMTSEDSEDPFSNMENHTIMKDGWVYVWNSNENTGYKMQSEDEELEDSDMEGGMESDMESDDYSQYNEALDMDQDFDYSCTPWVPNSSKFDLPTDIDFVDMEAMTGSFTESMGSESMDLDDPQSLCAVCDLSPDEATKAECKASLSCE